MKRRYSLRSLLVSVAVVALLSYWSVRPRIVALQFQRAIEEQRFHQADGFFDGVHDQHLEDRAREHPEMKALCVLEDFSFRDWLRGSCRGELTVLFLGQSTSGETLTMQVNHLLEFGHGENTCGSPMVECSRSTDFIACFQRLAASPAHFRERR